MTSPMPSDTPTDPRAEGQEAPVAKPLEWRWGKARTPFGTYEPLLVDDRWRLYFGPHQPTMTWIGPRHLSEAEAMEAAQADFEARVRSCLARPAPADDHARALREAARLLLSELPHQTDKDTWEAAWARFAMVGGAPVDKVWAFLDRLAALSNPEEPADARD